MQFLLHSHTEPSGYPTQLRIVQQTPAFVVFQWNQLKCHQENGPITGYALRTYYQFQYTEGTVDKNTTSYTIYDTHIQAFSVAAINEVGIGDHCPPVHVEMFISGMHFY